VFLLSAYVVVGLSLGLGLVGCLIALVINILFLCFPMVRRFFVVEGERTLLGYFLLNKSILAVDDRDLRVAVCKVCGTLAFVGLLFLLILGSISSSF
jgi:hypothetical protein